MEQIGIERHLCDTQISSAMEELQKNIRRSNNSGERERERIPDKEGGTDQLIAIHRVMEGWLPFARNQGLLLFPVMVRRMQCEGMDCKKPL